MIKEEMLWDTKQCNLCGVYFRGQGKTFAIGFMGVKVSNKQDTIHKMETPSAQGKQGFFVQDMKESERNQLKQHSLVLCTDGCVERFLHMRRNDFPQACTMRSLEWMGRQRPPAVPDPERLKCRQLIPDAHSLTWRDFFGPWFSEELHSHLRDDLPQCSLCLDVVSQPSSNKIDNRVFCSDRCHTRYRKSNMMNDNKSRLILTDWLGTRAPLRHDVDLLVTRHLVPPVQSISTERFQRENALAQTGLDPNVFFVKHI